MRTAANSCASRHAFAALGVGVLFSHSSSADAASSASYTISGDGFDAAGGVSSSTTYGLTACLGSEIAGTQSSATFRVDSGCGSIVALSLNDPLAAAEAVPVPTFGGGSELVLSMLVAALAGAYRRRIKR